MGMLGKDLFDLYRPITHARVEFGARTYWIEDEPKPIPYGTVLTELLDFDASGYKKCLSRLRETLPEDAAYGERMAEAKTELEKLPFYSRFLPKRYFSSDEPSVTFLMQLDEDLELIQDRYRWFLEEVFRYAKPEKQKGQRKLSVAGQIDRSGIGALVTGVSLGESGEVDTPSVQVQYVLRGEMEDTDPAELVERMYFDRLVDFVYVELMKGVQKNFIPKRCPNCGRWFLQEPGTSYSYCARPLEDEPDKTCRDVGSLNSFQAKTQNNEVWRYYQRAYKKYFARVRKGSMSRAEFEEWSRRAMLIRDRGLLDYHRAYFPEAKAAVAEQVRRELNAE